MNQKIGIDIGNVLTQRDTDVKAFGKNYLDVKEVDGAFESVKKLATRFGPKNIVIVSKCSLRNQKKSMEWLNHRGFFDVSGVPRENINFCIERIEKRAIANRHRLNYFIDDRWTVLVHLVDIQSMERLYLFKPPIEERNIYEGEYEGSNVLVVQSWQEVVDDIFKSS